MEWKMEDLWVCTASLGPLVFPCTLLPQLRASPAPRGSAVDLGTSQVPLPLPAKVFPEPQGWCMTTDSKRPREKHVCGSFFLPDKEG